MTLEMGITWMHLPWVTTVELLIGRMRSNASQEDHHNSRGIDVGETTAARDKLEEWLCEAPKTPEQLQREEDDALLAALGLKRPVEVSSGD